MPERVRAIVVGVGDHSEPDAGLAAAVEIARGSGASLHAVHGAQLSDAGHGFPLPAF